MYTCIYIYYPNSLEMGFLMYLLVIYPCNPEFLVARLSSEA